MYDISGRIERLSRNDEQGGSRTYAPRTSIGHQGVLSKEYPWLFAARRFLFGLVEVPRYYYDWGYSKAYIELMCMDTTIIHYLDEEDKKQKKLEDIEEAKNVYLQWKAKKEAQKQQETLTIKLNE